MIKKKNNDKKISDCTQAISLIVVFQKKGSKYEKEQYYRRQNKKERTISIMNWSFISQEYVWDECLNHRPFL